MFFLFSMVLNDEIVHSKGPFRENFTENRIKWISWRRKIFIFYINRNYGNISTLASTHHVLLFLVSTVACDIFVQSKGCFRGKTLFEINSYHEHRSKPYKVIYSITIRLWGLQITYSKGDWLYLRNALTNINEIY